MDGMRGIAAVCVLLDHAGIVGGFPQLAVHGAIAVDLFFMISGFVMARAYEARFAGMTAISFFRIRMVRLYPVILIGIILSAALSVYFPNVAPSVSGNAWLLHTLVIPNFSTHLIFPINSILWSLFFEVFANMLHWRFFRLSTKSVSIIALIAGIVFIAAAAYYGGAGVGAQPGDFWAGFARVGWGYSVGIVVYRISQLAENKLPALPAVALLLAVVLMLFFPPLAGKLRIAFPVFVGFPIIVLLAASSRPLPASISAPLNWLGEISYPLYAVHWPLLLMSSAVLARTDAFLPLITTVVLILLFASGIEYLFDLPLRSWVKSLAGSAKAQPARS